MDKFLGLLWGLVIVAVLLGFEFLIEGVLVYIFCWAMGIRFSVKYVFAVMTVTIMLNGIFNKNHGKGDKK